MKPQSVNPLDKTRLKGIDLQPGAVCVQWRTCGKPTCKCARGERHGPYYTWFWRSKGKLIAQYVKREDVDAVRAECQANREFQRDLRQTRKDAQQLLQRLRKTGI